MTDTTEPSALSEERLEILRLVENQTITAEEASRLLEALDRSDRGRSQNQFTEPIAPGFPAPPSFTQDWNRRGPKRSRLSRRNVRIRVTDVHSEESKLNLVLPGPLLNTGLTMARRFVPEFLFEAGDLQDTVDSGAEGTILDVVDDGQRVEIIVEDR
jgi:hypothetical protein